MQMGERIVGIIWAKLNTRRDVCRVTYIERFITHFRAHFAYWRVLEFRAFIKKSILNVHIYLYRQIHISSLTLLETRQITQLC
jgi:oligoribonuclease (3'-5' exoribonuclease)